MEKTRVCEKCGKEFELNYENFYGYKRFSKRSGKVEDYFYLKCRSCHNAKSELKKKPMSDKDIKAWLKAHPIQNTYFKSVEEYLGLD